MPIPKPTNPRFIDLEGKRFGRLVVLEYAGLIPAGTKQFAVTWLCRCDCGNTLTTRGYYLRGGTTTSCGCFRKEQVSERSKRCNRTHGKSRSPEYSAWRALNHRCQNPNNASFARYGGRGIRVCQRYSKSFAAFLADLGERPSPDHSVDRRDNNGNYSCGCCDGCIDRGWVFNVRWADPTQQTNNRAVTPMHELDGRTQSVADWAREYGMTRGALYMRLKRGWSLREALRIPQINPAPVGSA